MSLGVLQEGRQAPQSQGQRQAPVSWASSEGHTQHLKPEGDKRGHLGLDHTLGRGAGHPAPAGDPPPGREAEQAGTDAAAPVGGKWWLGPDSQGL